MSRIVKIVGTYLILLVILAACSSSDDGGDDNAALTNNNDAQAASITEDASNDDATVAAQPTTEAAAPENTENLEPALPLTENGEQIVAEVNGEAITLTEFQRTFDRYQLQSNAASFDALSAVVMNTLIQQRLINQEAATMGITVSEDEISTEFARNRGESTSDEQWQAWLAENLYTEDELRQYLRDWLLTQRVQEQIVQVDQVQIQEVRARHIVVGTEAEAQSVIERLQSGEDFATIAAELSRDVTTRDAGGELGWFSRDSLLTPELAEAAFQMQPGEIAGPVQTMLGYHIIELQEVRSRLAAQDEAYAAAARQFEAWIASLADGAQIERYINY